MYGGPLQGLLDHLGTRSLPSSLAASLLLAGGRMDGGLYDNGALNVTVTDHRLTPVAVYSVSLSPSPASLYADLQGLLGLSAKSSITNGGDAEEGASRILQLEAELYPLLEPGLSLAPSIDILSEQTTARYNVTKFQQTPRRLRRALAASSLDGAATGLNSEKTVASVTTTTTTAGKRKRALQYRSLTDKTLADNDEAERQTAKELGEWMTLLSPVRVASPRCLLLFVSCFLPRPACLLLSCFPLAFRQFLAIKKYSLSMRM